MDESVLYLETFKALREYRSLGPLTEEDWGLMKELIPGCPMQGQQFDEFNMLYPFKIPQKEIVHRLSKTDDVFSIGVRYNNSTFVNVVSDMDLLEAYNAHIGEFLFVVGKIATKEKQGRKFHKIRPRGWIIVTTKYLKENEEDHKEKILRKSK